jgi:hypothetical protein
MTDEITQETVVLDAGEDLWITTTSVINFHGLKPKQFNLDKDDETGLNNMLCDWIRQCQSLIETYTHRTYTDETVSPALQNILLRLVSNMCTLAIQRRDTPIIKVNDWNIQTVPSDIFTDDLKEDLKPFVKDSSNDYAKVGFFAITGEDDGGH